MSLQPGSQLGPYQVLAPLGAGGMGEVYKARDTRLDRTVALKVLPPELAADGERRARFEREARAIAALSHPHICVVHDVGHHNGADYLVMELLEGETLAARLGRAKARPLPINEVLRYATEIADALDKAHRAGVVHRDLKPANIMLTKSGAKLLDFGLAKLMGPAVPISMSAIEQATTTGGSKTASGTILGTVHYMPPEQVEGREADARSDIWALGVVIYEMATGSRPFDGDSGASIIGAILKDTPPALSTRQPLSPASLDHLVARCLEKDPDERWQHAGDVSRELQWIRGSAGTVSSSHPAHRRSLFPVLVAGTGLLGVVIGVGTMAMTSRRIVREPLPVLQFDVTAPPHATFAGGEQATVPTPLLAVSPDGKWLAFVAQGAVRDDTLWLRATDGSSVVALSGTEEATYPFWSPDSRAVAFFAQGKLKRIDIRSGAPQVICNAVDPRGGAWGANNIIVFGLNYTGLWRVSATSGDPTLFTKLTDNETGHRWPSFLPDGKHLLFQARHARSVDSTINVVDVDGTNRKFLFQSVFSPRYADGFLLTLSNGTLSAQPFDVATLTPAGDSTPIAQAVAGSTVNYGAFSASNTGLLAYFSDANAEMQLGWFDRSGRRLSTVGPVRDYADVELMPDERRALVTRTDVKASSSNIWSIDVNSGDSSPLTFDDSTTAQPVVSADGLQLVFRSSRELPAPIFHRLTSGAGGDKVLLRSTALSQIVPGVSGNLFPTAWSRDGRFILFHVPYAETGYDIFVLPMTGDRPPRPFIRTRGADLHARFSPDGKWVAYSSAESGRHQVYVQPFPDANGKWQISTEGGSEPRWRGDSREIFFLDADRRMMSARVAAQGSFEPDPPAPLFTTRIADFANPYRTSYAVTADGQRFLINNVAESATQPTMTVVVNWKGLLKR